MITINKEELFIITFLILAIFAFKNGNELLDPIVNKLLNKESD